MRASGVPLMRRAAATVLLVLVVAPSCNAVLGVEQLPGTRPISYAVPACQACTERSCLPDERACAGDPACASVYACLAKCGIDDVRCRTTCEVSVASTLPETYFAVDGCRRKACTAACYGSTGLAFAYSAACNACAVAKCGPEGSACLRSAAVPGAHVGDCERAIACAQLVTPQNPSISLDCTGVAKHSIEFDQLINCTYGIGCPECTATLGHDRRCVGEYTWSSPTEPRVLFSFGVHDYVKGEAVVGATVRACNATDCLACVKPVASEVVGTTGRVTMDVRSGFDGCFEIVKDGFVPTLWYPGRPLNHAWGGLDQTMLTHDDLVLATALLVPPVLLDDTRGVVAITAFDCTFSKAIGATVTGKPGDADTRIIYFSGATPSGSATATDGTGLAAIVNVPEGALDLTMAFGGATFGRWPVVVRKGALTAVTMFPNTATR